MKPSVGRIAHYVLNQQDVESITRRRDHYRQNSSELQTGFQAHYGNPVSAGEHVPMIICIVWPNEHGPNFDGVNGQVFLDGTDSLWITSAKEGMEPGAWHWPERIEE